MLGRKALGFLIGAIKFGNKVGSVPYGWDPKKGEATFVNTISRRIIWGIHNFIYCSYQAFVFLRWIQVAFIRESPTTATAIGTFYVFCAYSVVPAIQWSIFKNYGQHHIWINNYLEYVTSYQREQQIELQNRQGKVIKNQHDLADCYKAMRTFIIAGNVIFCLDTLSCFAGPAAPFFISSLLPDPMAMSAWELLPFVSFHMYIWLHQWATIFFFITAVLGYLTSIKNVMKTMKCTVTIQVEEGPSHGSLGQLAKGIVGGYFSNKVSKNPDRFYEECRRLEILQGYTNKIWSTTNVFYELAFISGSCLAFYGSVKVGGPRAIQQGVAATFVTSALIHIWKNMGEVYEISSEVLFTWRKMNRLEWFRKFHKSARPIRVTIGGFFFADREIKLTILSIIFDRTTSLLLSS